MEIKNPQISVGVYPLNFCGSKGKVHEKVKLCVTCGGNNNNKT